MRKVIFYGLIIVMAITLAGFIQGYWPKNITLFASNSLAMAVLGISNIALMMCGLFSVIIYIDGAAEKMSHRQRLTYVALYLHPSHNGHGWDYKYHLNPEKWRRLKRERTLIVYV